LHTLALPRTVAILSILCASTYPSEVWARTGGNIAALLGVGVLRDSPENQPSGGVDVTFGQKTWIVLPCAYFSYSRGEGQNAFGGDFVEKNYEAGLGTTKIWGNGALHPHLGFGFGGLWQVVHNLPGSEESEEGRFWSDDTGFWFEGGLFRTLTSRFNLGARVRLSGVGSSETTLGATHADVAIGWGWSH
jgi:hypothetical protein